MSSPRMFNMKAFRFSHLINRLWRKIVRQLQNVKHTWIHTWGGEYTVFEIHNEELTGPLVSDLKVCALAEGHRCVNDSGYTVLYKGKGNRDILWMIKTVWTWESEKGGGNQRRKPHIHTISPFYSIDFKDNSQKLSEIGKLKVRRSNEAIQMKYHETKVYTYINNALLFY